ncbi:MAG TPA: CBS domain-containing protein, partial [Acidimicrobiia bacterium]|nr:CBS domain-containing protein [Acidimicrobiia bacterium]
MVARPANRTTSEPAPRGGQGEASLVVRRVRDLAHPPLTCPPGATVAEAAGLMTRQGSTSVIVAGDGGAALGIVTDRDLTSRVVARRLGPETLVAEVMSSPVVGLAPAV